MVILRLGARRYGRGELADQSKKRKVDFEFGEEEREKKTFKFRLKSVHLLMHKYAKYVSRLS